MSRIGLYYPFIHFRDDNWVKLAALYWGKVARIVPRGYPTRDSRVVRELDDGLDLILNQPPGSASSAVGFVFSEVIAQHSEQLAERYRVDPARISWETERPRHPPGSPADEDFVAWIHVTKMTPDARHALLSAGLAVGARGENLDPRWIGVHPRVAEVYMTALAERIASERQFEPVTADPLHHVAASGWTVERLASALLDEPLDSTERAQRNEPGTALAFLAIETLVPKDLGAVPVARIVDIRTRYAAELAAFQDAIASLQGLEALQNVRSPDVLLDHLQVMHDERIKPELARLKRDLKLLKLDTAIGAMDMKIAVPGAVAGGAGVVGIGTSSTVAAGVGVAVGLATFAGSERRQFRRRYEASAVSYLLRIEEGTNPAAVSERVRRGVRQFIGGV